MEWRLWLPCIAMIVVEIGFAGMNVISKLAMNSGMNPIVMVTYRQLFATLVLLPFAYFCEIRKTKPKITRYILLMNFISSLLGATLNQWLYFIGLKLTTATVACGLINALPAITFVMALMFRLETLGIKRKAGIAKMLGTSICITGAMLMTFYRGKLINFGKSSIQWGYIHQNMKAQGNEASTVYGPMLVLASCVAWAGWFMLQAKRNNTSLAPYTSTTLMSAMATIECGIIGAFSERHISEWSLGFNIRLVAALYSGAVGSALAFCLMSWCIEKKGPLYASIFMPLLLVIMAVVGWTLQDEKIYMGTTVGAVLIVLGLYTFIWGTNREKNQRNRVEEKMSSKRTEQHQVRDDLESNNVEVMRLEMIKYEKRGNPESNEVAAERHDTKSEPPLVLTSLTYTMKTSSTISECPIWLKIRKDARHFMNQEPEFMNYYLNSILLHSSLESSLANLLAMKLKISKTLPTKDLKNMFLATFEKYPDIKSGIRKDLEAFVERDPVCPTYLQCMLHYKGFLACQSHRVANKLWIEENRKSLALIIQNRVSEVFSLDIHPGANIGHGIVFDHATGIVIGETSKIGNNVTIFHNVTLGATGNCFGDRHPKIDDNVLIGAGTIILGNIRIGECAKIGAASLVLKDVPSTTTVAGNPATLRTRKAM